MEWGSGVDMKTSLPTLFLLLAAPLAMAQTQAPTSQYVPFSPSFVGTPPMVSAPSSDYPASFTQQADQPKVNEQLPALEQTGTPAETPSQIPSPPPRWIAKSVRPIPHDR